MSRKAFTTLLLITLVVVALTIILRGVSPDYKTFVNKGDLAFPNFFDVVNSVASLSVESGGQTLTLEREGSDQWKVAERSGYPADSQKVREILLAIARMTAAEPKTARIDRFHRLQLEDPASTSNAKGRRLRARDQEGAVLLDVIFGKTAAAAQGVPEGGVYYRLSDQDQAWLGDSRIEPGTEVEDWIERQLIDIERDRINRITTTHPDGEVVQIHREGNGAEPLLLMDVPKGYRLQSEFRLNSIAEFLEGLTVVDVARIDEAEGHDVLASKTAFETTDGLTVTLSLFGDDDGGHWVRLSAAGAGDADTEASKITAQIEGWMFNISNWKAGNLKRRMADLIELDVPADGSSSMPGG